MASKVPDVEVRACLDRILSSPDFRASDRNRRFLAYVVNCALESRFDEISGYDVAVSVFGRPTDFNPTTDHIVRIEAGKLRKDLEFYYLKSGSSEEIRISLPRGDYVPVFRRAKSDKQGSDNTGLDSRGITVHSLNGNHGEFAQAEPDFRARVADLLARVGDVAVFAGPDGQTDGALLDSDTARELARRNGTRFILSGNLHDGGGKALFTARLHDGSSGRLVWSEDFVGTPIEVEESLVRRVAAQQRRALAEKLDAVSGGPACFPYETPL